jgi:type VI secretion system protein ImpJ
MMDNTFKIMNPVQWYEGLLLYPQHFQQMRREFQELSLCYLSMSTPYYWGVRHVAIDEGAFASGLLRIKTLLAVMPDGSVLRHDESSLQAIEINLKDYAEKLDQGPLMIHLAVVRYQKDAATVHGDFPRYDSVEGSPLVDENTGDGAVAIPRLSLKAYLVAGDTVPVRYASFPLFKVKIHEGGFAFENFIPPMTDIRKSSAIGHFAGDIVATLRKNIALLSERLQAPMTQDMAPVLDQYKQNYDLLVSRLLAIEAVTNAEEVHPFMLYRELCVIAGVFCAFSRGGYMPPILDPYNHNDLYKTFKAVIDLIEKMLELIKSASSAFSFRLEDRIFKNILKREWMQKDSIILGVVLPTGTTAHTMMDWVNEAVIASVSMAQKAIEKRVLGAPRESVEQVPELGLTITRGKLLLRVDGNSEYIKTGEDLYIFNVSDTDGVRPAEILLYTASE